MNTEIARLLERVRQSRAARAPEPRSASQIGASLPSAVAGAFVAGSRAFDLVNGEPVEVISVHREDVVVAAPERRNP
jgi:hypothetical protein